MKTRKTRIIALALAMLMALTLTACGGGNNTAPNDPPVSDTPAPTPNNVADNGNGDDSDTQEEKNNGDDINTPDIDDNFFPDIDNSLVPEILKKTVGTLGSANKSDKEIILVFTNCSEADWDELHSHYVIGGGFPEPSNDEVRIHFDWGKLEMTLKDHLHDSGEIIVTATLK